jgi:multiple sugar transport system ATP-binding protein
MAEVIVRKLNKKFDSNHVVKDVDLHIRDKEFVVFVGPSGCGKTTTLRMIAGLEAITSGDILIGNTVVNQVPPMDRDIAMVFQNYALYPHMSVASNMAFGLKMRKFEKPEIEKRIKRAAEILGIGELLHRKPRQLSGGQRQRVALGRAIVREPMCFLMDEPLGALDSEFRRLMCGELRELHDRIDATSIYITHDQLEAMAMADRIAIMNQGRVEQIGTPQEIYDRPRTMFVADFIGAPPMSFLGVHAALRRGDRILTIDGAPVEMPELLDERAEGKFALGVRPENVSFADSSKLRGQVIGAEYLGTTQIVTVTTANGRVKARLPSGKAVRVGETVGLKLRPDKLSLFDATSGEALSSALDVGERHG